MPTSLLSTGVQFPDSTIQTTAASGGMALISTVNITSGAYNIYVTGIASYKSIILITETVVGIGNGPEKLYVSLSTDNGTSYGSSVEWSKSAYSVSGFIQFFDTDAVSTEKPFVMMHQDSQRVLYTNVPSAGAVNAIRIISGTSEWISGTIFIYGVN